MASKHGILVHTRSIAVSFWEIRTFKKVKKRVSEATLVIGVDINYCVLFLNDMRKWLPPASLKQRVLHHL